MQGTTYNKNHNSYIIYHIAHRLNCFLSLPYTCVPCAVGLLSDKMIRFRLPTTHRLCRATAQTWSTVRHMPSLKVCGIQSTDRVCIHAIPIESQLQRWPIESLNRIVRSASTIRCSQRCLLNSVDFQNSARCKSSLRTHLRVAEL